MVVGQQQAGRYQKSGAIADTSSVQFSHDTTHTATGFYGFGEKLYR